MPRNYTPKKGPKTPPPVIAISEELVPRLCAEVLDQSGLIVPSEKHQQRLARFIVTIQVNFVQPASKAKGVADALRGLLKSIHDVKSAASQALRLLPSDRQSLLQAMMSQCEEWQANSIFRAIELSRVYTDHSSTIAPIIGGAFKRILKAAGNPAPDNGEKGPTVMFLVALMPHLTGENPTAAVIRQSLQAAGEVEPPAGWPED